MYLGSWLYLKTIIFMQNIALTYSVTGVWEWLCANNSCPNINWQDEVNKYKEAING